MDAWKEASTVILKISLTVRRHLTTVSFVFVFFWMCCVGWLRIDSIISIGRLTVFVRLDMLMIMRSRMSCGWGGWNKKRNYRIFQKEEAHFLSGMDDSTSTTIAAVRFDDIITTTTGSGGGGATNGSWCIRSKIHRWGVTVVVDYDDSMLCCWVCVCVVYMLVCWFVPLVYSGAESKNWDLVWIMHYSLIL